ncbi:MAG: DNA-3-methyladenine glycosylase family protein [Candidatus Nanopelagicales bacterium]
MGATRVWRPGFLIDARLTLSPLARGRYDPSHQIAADGALWRASLLDSGPVTYRLAQSDLDQVAVSAWGPGAPELLEAVPSLLGVDDNPADFAPEHPVLRHGARVARGMRIMRTGRVLEALIPAIIEQRVVGLDAQAAWRRLLRQYGAPAPVGPGQPPGMYVTPGLAGWRAVPSWEWHRAGVDPGRMRRVQQVLPHAAKLEAAAASGERAEVYRLLTAIPGIGRWTAAEVGQRVLGDADALPIGDYHLAANAGYALLGRPLGDDEVEPFFEQWRGHRYRVVRLLAYGPKPPRRGPRASRDTHRLR